MAHMLTSLTVVGVVVVGVLICGCCVCVVEGARTIVAVCVPVGVLTATVVVIGLLSKSCGDELLPG